MAAVHKTGLVCPQCRQPVGKIVNSTPDARIIQCQVCGHRWTAVSPRTTKQ